MYNDSVTFESAAGLSRGGLPVTAEENTTLTDQTSLAAAFRVSHSALLAEDRHAMMIDTSGRKCCELFEHVGPISLWQRTLLASLMSSTGFSKTYSLRWKPQVTKRSRRLWFQLAPLVHGTAATEFGFLPTLTRAAEAPNKNSNKRRGPKSYIEMLRFMPTLIPRDGRTFKGAKRTPKALGTEPLCVELGGTPNPEWAEWYMGYEPNWTNPE